MFILLIICEEYSFICNPFFHLSNLDVISRTGKTLLAKTLARLVNVPFVIADATTLTQASFHFINLLDI